MKVTLKDISEATGFSISTVSRALRGEGRISEEHRHNILAAAHELGYALPANKQSQPFQNGNYVAIITEFKTGEFFASFFHGFSQAARNKHIEVSLFDIANNPEKVEILINNLRSLGYMAAVIFLPDLKEKIYRKILHTTPKDFPVISCSNIDNPVLDTVTFDAYRGASLVANHFCHQEFRSFGIIEGPLEKPEARFRTNGFADFIKYHKGFDLIWQYRGDYSTKGGQIAYEAFSKLENKPRAVFSANDSMAFGFMESARADGWHFPNDIALAGYDNLPMCDYHYPRLTSVNTDYTLLGKNTLDNLLSRVGNPDNHQGIVSLVPVSLEVRDSSLSNAKISKNAKKDLQSVHNQTHHVD